MQTLRLLTTEEESLVENLCVDHLNTKDKFSAHNHIFFSILETGGKKLKEIILPVKSVVYLYCIYQ